MAIPAIKALKLIGHAVDILIGTTPDDVGAYEVFAEFKKTGFIGNIYRDSSSEKYDIAILAIPFDGRWKNGVHFFADTVVDGRSRPDPSTTGLVSWKKHEIEYQVDNVRQLGYTGDIPSCSFSPIIPTDEDFVYVGVGYKKDAAEFWKKKHWGNENFSKFISLATKKYDVKTTGNIADLQICISPILNAVKSSRFSYCGSNLLDSFSLISKCKAYVGNDTGMMHVAAAFDKKVIGLFFLENSITKSRPWCENFAAVDCVENKMSPDDVYARMEELISW